MHWNSLEPDVRERLFRERYRRPAPWFEVVGAEGAEELAWVVSARIGLEPASMDLGRVLEAAWERMPGRRRSDLGLYHGGTEPLASAAPRLGLPRDGVVHLWHHWFRHERADACTVRMRTRDVIEFEGILWRDDTWMIEDEGRWLLAGMHDWPAYLWRFAGRPAV